MKKSSNITVKFKKLSKKAVLPTYAHPTDAGMDLIAVSRTDTDRYVEYGLGFATEIPEGWAGFCFPNSRISKYDLSLANSVGIIDDSYRGEWKLRFKRNLWSSFKFEIAKLTNFFGLKDFDIGWSSNAKTFNVGDVVGQVVFMPVPRVNIEEVEDLSDTERGDGGFGSTQNNNTDSTEAIAETPKKEVKRKPRKKK